MNSFEITSLLLGSIKGFAREPPPSVGSWHTHTLERPWPMAASVCTCAPGRGPLPSSCSPFCRALSTLSGKELTFRNPRDLLAGEPAAFIEAAGSRQTGTSINGRHGRDIRGSSAGRRGYQARSPGAAESGCGASATQVDSARLVRNQGDRSPAGRDRPACSRRAPDFRTGHRPGERRRAAGDGRPRNRARIRLDRMESCPSTRRSGATQGAGAGLRRDCRCHIAPARNGSVKGDRRCREGHAIQPRTVWIGHQREELSDSRGTPGVCSRDPSMAAGFQNPTAGG